MNRSNYWKQKQHSATQNSNKRNERTIQSVYNFAEHIQHCQTFFKN